MSRTACDFGVNPDQQLTSLSLSQSLLQNKRTVYDQYGEEGLKANGGAGPGANPFGAGTGGGAFPGASFGFGGGGGGGGFQATDPNDLFS